MTVRLETLKDTDGVGVVSAVADGSANHGLYHVVGKRLLDVALIMLTSPVWITVLGVITLMLFASGQHPFYLQRRLGRHGRAFRMIKFQTMVPNAERVLAQYLARNASAREEWAKHQKLRNDPRVTRLGRILRKTSMDELPQLLNVLNGDMSLVGPRPMMVNQRELYPGTAYFELRPGITGPWQVSDRNNCAFRERADFDTRYLNDISLTGDAALLLSTAAVVVRGTGY